MAVRNASAKWVGTLKEGAGTVALGSGAFEGQYSFSTRFEEGTGTNPEELVGAAHAGCYSMQLNVMLERNDTPADYVDTTAKVHLTKAEAGGFEISKIELITEAAVPGMDAETFQKWAADAKDACLISKLYSGSTAEITLEATLK
jgi:osmotically inducible protein OsmC